MLKTSEKYGAETESHLSILYGLDPNTTAQQCREKLSPWLGRLVEVELDENGTSIFENGDRPYDVVKIDVKMSKELKAMNSALRELPFENDFPDFKAHITLAYVKKGKGKNYVGLKSPKTAEISKIVLSDPDGNRSSTLWKTPKVEAKTWYELAKQADGETHEVYELLKDTYFSEGYRGFGADAKEYVEENNWSLEEIDLSDLVKPERHEWIVEWLEGEGPSMTDGPIVVGPNPTDEDRIPWKGYEILDGWHRVAEAVARGKQTISGWVGRPKATVQAKTKLHLTKTAQFGAQFTKTPGANSQAYGNDYWNHQTGLTELLLEHVRNADPEQKELLEKRMNQDRSAGKVERQQIVDPKQPTETLLDPGHDPDVAYKSTEQLMESHRAKPLVLASTTHLAANFQCINKLCRSKFGLGSDTTYCPKCGAPVIRLDKPQKVASFNAQQTELIKTAFDYTTDSAEDIESRWGWMNNVDDPMAVRVQGPNRFDEGLNWTWREGKSDPKSLDASDQSDPSDYRNVARQSRYNPEFVNGIYYEWIEPRDGADEDDPGKVSYLGYGTAMDGDLSFNSRSCTDAAQFQRFAQNVFAPVEGLRTFIQAVKQQVGTGKIQGTRLLISPQLADAVAVAAGDDLKIYAPLPVSSSLEIRYSSPHLGYATETFKDTTPQAAITLIKARIGKDVTINWVRTCACPIWLVDPTVEEASIQAAEEFAAGSATPENRQAFEAITRLGSIKQESVATICKLIQSFGSDLGLAVAAPELPTDKTAEDWIGINNLTVRCGSLDEALKLSGLLVDSLGGRNSVLLPDGEVDWKYRGLCCRFLYCG